MNDTGTDDTPSTPGSFDDDSSATRAKGVRGGIQIAGLGLALLGLACGVTALLGVSQSRAEVASLRESLDRVDESSSTSTEASSSLVSAFDPPADLGALLAEVQASTVTIQCKGAQGSGWVIDLGSPGPEADPDAIELDREFPTEVITNDHVIEQCHETPRKVTATAGGQTYDAVLYSYDTENDLALIAIKQDVPPLELSDEPQPGWWAVAVGTPYGLEGSVSIGNVMNLDGTDVIATTPLNSGNSGGPMVNSRGEVIGTNTWVRVGTDEPQDWNVAVAHTALCDELVDCAGATGWDW